jgi:hypothetical protein
MDPGGDGVMVPGGDGVMVSCPDTEHTGMIIVIYKKR